MDEELLKEAIYLLGKYGPQECPDWIEGIGDCGNCEACRVFQCMNALEAASQPAVEADAYCECKLGATVYNLSDTHCVKCKKRIRTA